MAQIDDIKKDLARKGGAQSNILDEVSAEQWRRDARAAARALGRPVQTIRHDGVVAAVLRDWPSNELETEIHRAAMRRAVNATALTMPPRD